MQQSTESLILTERQSRGLGALAARTQSREIDRRERHSLNRPDAWCCARERWIANGLDFDAWHEGWDMEIADLYGR